MKRFLVVLLILAITLSLFACVEEEKETDTDGETENETEVPTEREPVYTDTEASTELSTESESEGISDSETVDISETETVNVTETVAETEIGTETVIGTENEPDTEGETVKEAESSTEELSTEGKTDEMETVILNDGLASVGKYEEYDLDTYMSPIWDGKVVHNETVMFVGIDDKASLLYDADKIISVRSYDLSIEYVQGVDYDYVDGKLVLLEGTRIPYVPLETYYSVLDPNYPYLSTMYNGKVTQTMFGDGTTMTQWQVAVTYKHSDTWDGPIVESYEDRYADFIEKLENGEDVTVFFYGDSITTGATSSQSRAPYAPSFPRMFVQYVAKQYGYTVKYVDTYSDFTTNRPSGGTAHADSVFGTNGTITYINTAVGGWSTKNGLDNYNAYVGSYIAKHGCDLFLLAFGMNNGGSTASDVASLLEQIVRLVYRSAPDTDVVLVSTMIPNPEAVRNPADTYFCNGNQYTFEEEMYPLAEKINTNALNCAVAPMTSVSQYIHSQKRYRDTTGNNVNHPSDFLARTYAQVIYQTVFGYENYEAEPIELGETPVINANYNAYITSGGSKLYLDGKSGTADANFAACVRIESAEGGFYMYHISDGAKVYINATDSGVDYDADASTVWTYNATLKAMVCKGSDITIKLITPEICLHPIVYDANGHYRETCVRCGIERETGTHNSFAESVTTNSDGSTEYVTKCSICGYVSSAYTIPAGINHYYPITDIALYNGTSGSIKTENGVRYYRSIFTNAEGHVFVNGVNSTTAIVGDTGRYLVMKYRASNNSRIRLDLCTSDHEADRSTVSRGASKIATSWEIAVIDLSQFANYTCDSELNVQVRMTTASEYIDIAYIAIVDSTDEARTLMTDDVYVLYTDWSADGTVCKVSDSTDEETTEGTATENTEKIASVGIYEEYNIDSYMTPIWDGKVVHNETVMFVGIDDKAPLLYDADKIISVRSYDLSIEYVHGVDYDYVDGKLVLLEGTRIPYVPLETYYSVLNNQPYLSTMYNGVVTQTMFGEGDAMCKWQVAVTYKHSDIWEGIQLESYADRFDDFISKLENGEDVTVFFYGDSITTGANSSQTIGKAPYAPNFARMFVQYVAKQYGYTVTYVNSYSDENLTAGKPAGGVAHSDTVYGTNGTITYINNAVGGWSTENGNDNFDAYVKSYIETYGCDLFVLAFGMNNGGSTADTVVGVLEEIVGKVEACAQDADVLLVSTMIPNPEAVENPLDGYYCNGNQKTFEAAMIPLAEKINESGTDCALAPMTSVSQYIHSQKRYRDTTGNNVNHPSDFLARAYAQVICQTVFGFENFDNEVNELGETPVVNANYNGILTLADNTLFLDGGNGTENANDAVCIRLEACEGGYYLYCYIETSERAYINVDADGNIVYDATAFSVWTYDETLGAMVCGEGELVIKLVAPEICLHPIVAMQESHGREECVRCGIVSTVSPHIFAENISESDDNSVKYATVCSVCDLLISEKTVLSSVKYYSTAAIYQSPDFYLLNHYAGMDVGGAYTRITPADSNHGHELHFIHQNYETHYDYTGKQLDTEGAQYVVIKLRASDAVSMKFIYTVLDGGSGTIALPQTALKADEWVTFVIDLKSATPNEYVAREDGSYIMHRFKILFGTDFVGIENAYVDFSYMAICDDWDEVKAVADQNELMLIVSSGSAGAVTKERQCIKHTVTETVSGNVYSWSCSFCNTSLGSKTVPESVNVFTSASSLSAQANSSPLINYSEVIADGEERYARIYGGSADPTDHYNQFFLYSDANGSTVTGQYLVIKYRVGENGLGQNSIILYVGTENSSPMNGSELIQLQTTVEDGEWHTAIIDMSTTAGLGSTESLYKESESDGLYRAKFICLRPFFTGYAGGDESDYMDVAFSAICDNLDEAKALVDASSYEYYTGSVVPQIINSGQ